MNLDPASMDLHEELGDEIYAIANEAMANAAKHARASLIEVSLSVGGPNVIISITDDGIGFPFTGEYTRKDLDRLGSGPMTLKERVAALGGDLRLRTSGTGSTIEIRIGRSAATLPA
jgi:signal transduction histidine kinase